MKIVCIMPVRSEEWILGLSLRAVMQWADIAVVLDHDSNDATPKIIKEVSQEYAGRVFWKLNVFPEWNEMDHRQLLLETARKYEATHIVMVDADEVLTGNLLSDIRSIVERLPDFSVLQLPWVCLARGINSYYQAGLWYNNWVSCAFKDHPSARWAARNGYHFHHRHPMGMPISSWERPVAQDAGGLMHLQFVNERRLKAKQYLYQLTERMRWPTREPIAMVRSRYAPAVYESDPHTVATAKVPATWWAPYQHLMKYYHPEMIPWQEAEIRTILEDCPGIEQGLDNFGIKL